MRDDMKELDKAYAVEYIVTEIRVCTVYAKTQKAAHAKFMAGDCEDDEVKKRVKSHGPRSVRPIRHHATWLPPEDRY